MQSRGCPWAWRRRVCEFGKLGERRARWSERLASSAEAGWPLGESGSHTQRRALGEMRARTDACGRRARTESQRQRARPSKSSSRLLLLGCSSSPPSSASRPAPLRQRRFLSPIRHHVALHVAHLHQQQQHHHHRPTASAGRQAKALIGIILYLINSIQRSPVGLEDIAFGLRRAS